MTDLDQTRRFLGQIPALAAKLPEFLTGTTPKGDEGSRRPVPGSRPPVDVGLLDLIDGRDIQWWTMLTIDEMADDRDMTEALEEAPSSRIPSIADNCQFLANFAEWITAAHEDFAGEIQALYWNYRRAARELPGPSIKCVACGGESFVDGIWLICREVEEHARTVKSIENQHRYRPAVPAADIVAEFAVDHDKLRDWKRRGRIRDAGKDGQKNLFYPWDVFLLLNPVIREALDARDSAIAG